MRPQAYTEKNGEPDNICTRDFVLICPANCFIFLGFLMPLPTSPMLVKDLGGSDQAVGVIVVVFTFSALVLRPYAGHALESKGRRFVYMFCLVLFVLSVGAFGFITSIVLLFFVRIIQGIGWGFSNTATGTIATDL